MPSKVNFIIFFALTLISVYVFKGIGKKSNHKVPVISTPYGTIQGSGMLSNNGRGISSYTGIPFAKPPIGDLRFKKPQSLPDNYFKEPFDATKSVAKCVQPSEIPTLIPVKGQEDCLQLNVYVPNVEKNPENGLPVMVWFHGGGFTSGDSSNRLYGPEYLLDDDVILVTSNYRLGIFGFLTLGNEELAGNQGMWDQVEALKWVQKNIGSFGGNKDKVTIFGESAGGYSISYHLTSGKSKNLFHSAIVQSGSLEKGIPAKDQRSLVDVHREFSEKMGCPYDEKSFHDVVKCLQTKSVVDLMKGMKMFDQCNTIATGMMAYPLVWTPLFDGIYSKDPFFAQEPVEALKKGSFNKVPTMIGALNDEGLLFTSRFLQEPDLYTYFKSNWEECAANAFLNMFFIGDKGLDKSAKDKINAIEKFYKIGNELSIEDLAIAFGDSKFLYGAEKMAQQLAKHTQTFYYHFTHQGSFSMSDIFAMTKPEILWTFAKKAFGIHDSKRLGVCHADDLLYLFKSSLPIEILPDTRDKKMINLMVKLWANFAKHHNPTPDSKDWPAMSTKNGRYVILNEGKIINEKDSKRDERIKFWQKLAEM